jgi:RNA polymerase sigma factor (sigma-70 family)
VPSRCGVMSPLALSIRFLQTQPDSKLLQLARAGHERAFEALVQRYRRPLLNYCRRLSRSEVSAEDALQQALLQAWIALSGGESEIKDVRAWLYRIVHNVAISSLRRPVHDQVREDRAGDGNGADQEVERRLAIREALAGLASLPELQRQVMLSTALEGQSHHEVATALGLSHGAVRGLIYRARATLRAAAAAVMPGPLISWAARQDVGTGGRSAAIAETIAGGGSAGVAGVLLKGGAIVATAGALAGVAGVALHPGSHRSHAHKPLSAQLRSAGAPLAGGRPTGNAASGAAAVPVVLRPTGPSAATLISGAGAAPTTSAHRRRWQLTTPSGQHSLAFVAPTGSSSGSGSTSKGGSSGHGPSGSGESSGSHSSSGSSGPGHDGSGHDGSASTTSGSESSGSSGNDGSPSGGGGGAATAMASSSGSDGSSSTRSSPSDGSRSGSSNGSSSGGGTDPSGSGTGHTADTAAGTPTRPPSGSGGD